MLKVKFVDSCGNYRGYMFTNTTYGHVYCAGLYCPEEEEILIVRQQHALKIIYIFIHELGHWLGHKLYVPTKVHMYHDHMDRKLFGRFFGR